MSGSVLFSVLNIHITFTVTPKRDVKSEFNSITYLIHTESLSRVEGLHAWWLLDIADITI